MHERDDYADHDMPPGNMLRGEQTAWAVLGVFLGVPVAIGLLSGAAAFYFWLKA